MLFKTILASNLRATEAAEFLKDQIHTEEILENLD